MDITMKLYLCGIAIGYIIGIIVSIIERQLRHLTYFDGYKEGLDMGLQFIRSHNKICKSVNENDKRCK